MQLLTIIYIGSLFFFLMILIFFAGKKSDFRKIFAAVAAVLLCGALFLCVLSAEKEKISMEWAKKLLTKARLPFII